MAFRLGPDGKPQEVKTSYDKGEVGTQPPTARQEGATMPPPRPKQQSMQEPATQAPKRSGVFDHMDQASAGGSQNVGGGIRPDGFAHSAEPPTRPARNAGVFDHMERQSPLSEPGVKPVGMPPSTEPKTQIHMGRAKPSGIESVDELVCGWLVVVDGPGKGKSLVVGPGQSIISRSAEQRLCLNFGDDTITSKEQLRILFDDEEREFLISPGNGTSLNRLNGQVVGGLMPITTGDLLKVGKTTLRFVAFCDKNFCWE